MGVHVCACVWLTYIKWVQVGDGSPVYSVPIVHIQVVTLEDVKYAVVVLSLVSLGRIVDTNG